MIDHPKTVSELGERALIDRIVRRLDGDPEGEIWAGDDAAVVEATGDRMVITVDMLVEGVDFEVEFASGIDVGWKAMAISASDCAAMGARPTRGVVGLALPGDTPVSLVDGIAEGIREAASLMDAAVVGGDISEASEISLAVTMVGNLITAPITRSGAVPGDLICVTGTLGGAAGGLLALQQGLVGPGPTEGHGFSPELSRSLVRLAARQLRPVPRLREGEAFARLPVTSMIDVSDGLAVDLQHLMTASGTGCEVDEEAVPVDPDLDALREAVGELDPLELAIVGGEDFELLFTASPEAVGSAGADVSVIGRVTSGACRIGSRDLEQWVARGWEHLTGGAIPRPRGRSGQGGVG